MDDDHPEVVDRFRSEVLDLRSPKEKQDHGTYLIINLGSDLDVSVGDSDDHAAAALLLLYPRVP